MSELKKKDSNSNSWKKICQKVPFASKGEIVSQVDNRSSSDFESYAPRKISGSSHSSNACGIMKDKLEVRTSGGGIASKIPKPPKIT